MGREKAMNEGKYWLRFSDFFEDEGDAASSLCPEMETSFFRNFAILFLVRVPVDWELFLRATLIVNKGERWEVVWLGLGLYLASWPVLE